MSTIPNLPTWSWRREVHSVRSASREIKNLIFIRQRKSKYCCSFNISAHIWLCSSQCFSIQYFKNLSISSVCNVASPSPSRKEHLSGSLLSKLEWFLLKKAERMHRSFYSADDNNPSCRTKPRTGYIMPMQPSTFKPLLGGVSL